jgi:hypothetical protein
MHRGRLQRFVELAVLPLALGRCMPDFDRLQTGQGRGNGGASQTTDPLDSGMQTASGGSISGSGGSGGGPCVTAFEGGDVAFAFDNRTLAGTGLSGAWVIYPEGSPALADSRVTWSEAEGRSCPGALALNVTFDVYGEEKVAAVDNFSADWARPMAYTVLHGWVKIVVPESGSLSYLRGVQLSVSSGPNYEAYRSTFVNPDAFVDGDWHELLVTLEPTAPPPVVGAYVPESVRQIGVQAVAALVAPGGGPVAPLPTTFFLDDVWLERP